MDSAMRSFKDTQGRTWIVSITFHELKLCRKLLGVKLADLSNDCCKPLGELIADAERFVDVLYVLCKEQADKANVSDADFGRSLDGDAIEAAIHAFVGAFADFSPSRTRALILGLADKMRETETLIQAALPDAVRAVREMSAEAILDSMQKPTAAGLPALSGSTPTA
jgi:hypothetical protein